MILFVAGDPGGSRAIMAVAEYLVARGEDIFIAEHGAPARETPAHMRKYLIKEEEALSRLPECDACVLGTSVSDDWPLGIARKAKENGAFVLHVLDNWSSYLSRLQTDGQPPFLPDIYTVIDADAYREATKAGVPSGILRITGQPALAASAIALEKSLKQRRNAIDSSDTLNLLFISEPFVKLFGPDVGVSGHPGFTEETVLRSVAESLKKAGRPTCLNILPHPKQTCQELDNFWQTIRGDLAGRIVEDSEREKVFSQCDLAIGMTSILLYEAWLGGIPVACFQPEYRVKSMERFKTLRGIHYADKYEDICAVMTKALEECGFARRDPRPECSLHKNAPALIGDMLLERMRAPRKSVL